MKGLFTVMMTVFFVAGSSGMAFADGGDASTCASSALVCKSLDFLDVESGQTVAHPCTTIDGDPGAWVCPDADGLAENGPDQPSPQSSAGQNFRDLMGQ